MDTFLSRLPTADAIAAALYQHRGKIAGFATGSIGMWVLTTFLVVFITGVPLGGERLNPDRFIVYPNF